MASGGSNTRIAPPIYQAPVPRARRQAATSTSPYSAPSPLEATAVIALFDQRWDENDPPYVAPAGDPNAYSTGVIGARTTSCSCTWRAWARRRRQPPQRIVARASRA